MEMPAPKSLGFDQYVLDPLVGRLQAHTKAIELRPRAFDVLYYLVRRSGQLVTKDELLEAVWPRVVVTDHSLTQCVREIRQALGDDDHRIVRTVPRRGYIFTRPVAEVEGIPANNGADKHTVNGADVFEGTNSIAGDGASPKGARSRLLNWRHPLFLAAAVLLIVVAAAMAVGYNRHNKDSYARQSPLFSLVVLPIKATSGDAADVQFAETLTADLTLDVSRIANSFVIAPSIARNYRNTDVKQAGRDLGVRYVLEGSVSRAGERAWLDVGMVDADTGQQVWAERFTGTANDLASLQAYVKGNFSRKVELELTEAEAARVRRERPDNPTAEDLVVRGAALVEKQTPETIDRARQLALAALDRDPELIRAWTLLAFTYFIDISFRYDALHGSREDWIRRAIDAARKAYAINPNDFQAIGMYGWSLQWEGKFEDAMVYARRQISMNPNYPQAYNRLALSQLYAGRPQEAIATLKEGLLLAPRINNSLARGNYEHNAVSLMALALLHLGRDAEAMKMARKAIEIKPDFPSTRAFLAAAAANLGDMDTAHASLAVFRRQLPGYTLRAFAEEGLSDRPEYLAKRAHFFDGLRKAGLEE